MSSQNNHQGLTPEQLAEVMKDLTCRRPSQDVPPELMSSVQSMGLGGPSLRDPNLAAMDQLFNQMEVDGTKQQEQLTAANESFWAGKSPRELERESQAYKTAAQKALNVINRNLANSDKQLSADIDIAEQVLNSPYLLNLQPAGREKHFTRINSELCDLRAKRVKVQEQYLLSDEDKIRAYPDVLVSMLRAMAEPGLIAKFMHDLQL
jgi:hypothetical protein